MNRMRAGAVALLLTAGTGLALTGVMGSASAATTPAPGTTTPPPAAAPVSPTEAFVGRAYEDLMTRPADPTGKAYWVQQINQGMTHAAMAATLAQTDIYRNVVVERAYLQTLGRNPDPGGLQYWTGYLAKGGNVDQLTGNLVGSTEYASQFGANYDAFVKATYNTLLGRNPDPAGEAFWVGRLASGIPMWNVAASVSHVSEWYQNRVYYDYVFYHVGFPDAQGLSFWAHSMQSGMPEWKIVAGLIGSNAYATWAQTHP
jgi:hypothetical protein